MLIHYSITSNIPSWFWDTTFSSCNSITSLLFTAHLLQNSTKLFGQGMDVSTGSLLLLLLLLLPPFLIDFSWSSIKRYTSLLLLELEGWLLALVEAGFSQIPFFRAGRFTGQPVLIQLFQLAEEFSRDGICNFQES